MHVCMLCHTYMIYMMTCYIMHNLHMHVMYMDVHMHVHMHVVHMHVHVIYMHACRKWMSICFAYA